MKKILCVLLLLFTGCSSKTSMIEIQKHVYVEKEFKDSWLETNEFGDSYIKELSGGQKQRVAIARALARNPEIILFDEPTSALDPELVNGVLEVISSLKGTNITMVIVSHEMNFVKNISDRVVFMEQGQVLKTGKVDEIFDKNYFPRIENYLNNF